MDISFWIVLWIIFLIVQNVADKKKKSKQPPINSENPPDFEIPTLSNDPNFPDEETSIQSAEVREINLAGIYRQKKIEAQNFSEQPEKIPEVDKDILKILSPRESVNRRNTYGGTGFEQVAKQIEIAKGKL